MTAHNAPQQLLLQAVTTPRNTPTDRYLEAQP